LSSYSFHSSHFHLKKPQWFSPVPKKVFLKENQKSMKKRTKTKLESEFQVAVIIGIMSGIADNYDLYDDGIVELIEKKIRSKPV
jgi:RecB family exonuclease